MFIVSLISKPLGINYLECPRAGEETKSSATLSVRTVRRSSSSSRSNKIRRRTFSSPEILEYTSSIASDACDRVSGVSAKVSMAKLKYVISEIGKYLGLPIPSRHLEDLETSAPQASTTSLDSRFVNSNEDGLYMVWHECVRAQIPRDGLP
jgi:hypothetical protein